jgi:hypothetical protein
VTAPALLELERLESPLTPFRAWQRGPPVGRAASAERRAAPEGDGARESDKVEWGALRDGVVWAALRNGMIWGVLRNGMIWGERLRQPQ